jgi:hypothetical protein
METKTLNELTDLLTYEKHGNLYDFVCNNYYLLSKEELKDLLKEAFALLYEKQEAENIRNNREYDYYKSLHNEYLETLKENTTIFEE